MPTKELTQDYAFEIEFCERLIRRSPDDPTILELLAGYYTRAGSYQAGLELDEKLVKLAPENPVNHYNLACSLALLNRLDDAISSLRIAIELGYTDFNWMLEDEDLEPLRDYPPFLSLLREHGQI